jgi:hypothetical protein
MTMRSRFVAALGVLGALAVSASVATAQDSKPVSVGVMGGLSLPMGDLGDAVESGFNITGSVYFMPSGSRFGLRGDLGYDSFSGKGNSNFNSNILSFTGNVLLPVGTETAEGSIRPYVIGGGGFYRFSNDVPGSDSNTDFGIGVGGGLEFKLAGFSTFAEARFVNVFSDPGSTRWIPITFGVRF